MSETKLTAAEIKTLDKIERGHVVLNYHHVRALLDLGYVTNPCQFRLTPAGYLVLGFEECNGEAHSNAMIDNCGRCAPRWGWVKPPTDWEWVKP